MPVSIQPILKLPLQVQHIVIQSMEVDEIFSFSMSGVFAKRVVQRMTWHIVATMMDFQNCVGKSTIIGENEGRTVKRVKWKVMRNDKGNFIPKMKVNNTIFEFIQLNPLSETSSWNDTDFQRWFIRYSLPYFGEIFGPLRRIGTSMMLNQMRILPNRAMIKQCLIVDKHAHARQITDFCNQFTGRALILRSTVQGSIEINSGIMNIPHVYLEDATWLTGAHLNEFSGKNLFAFNTTIYTDDVVQLVKEWINGSNKRLRSIVLTMTNGIPFDPEDVMRSFPEAKKWNPELRHRFYIYKEQWKMELLMPHLDLLDCSTGMDIIRESDDMIATIQMTKSAFCFFVWHRRFPNAGHGN